MSTKTNLQKSTNRPTKQELLLANVLVSKSCGGKAKLVNRQALELIDQQLDGNLSWLSREQTAAYVGLSIIKNKPFSENNSKTAIAISLSMMTQAGYKLRDRQVLSGLIKILLSTSELELATRALIDSHQPA